MKRQIRKIVALISGACLLGACIAITPDEPKKNESQSVPTADAGPSEGAAGGEAAPSGVDNDHDGVYACEVKDGKPVIVKDDAGKPCDCDDSEALIMPGVDPAAICVSLKGAGKPYIGRDVNCDGVPDCPASDGGAGGAAGAGGSDGGTDSGVECTSDTQCGDSVVCTVDVCSAGKCLHNPNDSLCAANQKCDAKQGCQTPAECISSGQCDDLITCTVDVCSAGKCLNQPNDALCPSGQKCNYAKLGCEAPPECTSDAQCGDSVVCTVDTCVSGKCYHQPNDLLCKSGEKCDSTLGCKAQVQCTKDSDCSDAVTCTVDVCSGGKCLNQPNDALCPSGQKCDAKLGCQAVSQCTKDADCSDAVNCTVDVCSGNKCLNVANDSLCKSGEKCDAKLGCQAAPQCTKDSDCSDGVTCTVDVCSGGKCLNQPNDALCSSGQKCDAKLGCQTTSVCSPGATQTCSYFCAASSQNIPGLQKCKSDGSGYEPCDYKLVTPGSEAGKCSDALDNDCNGKIDLADTACQSSPLQCSQFPDSITIGWAGGSSKYRLLGDTEGLCKLDSNYGVCTKSWCQQDDTSSPFSWQTSASQGLHLFNLLNLDTGQYVVKSSGGVGLNEGDLAKFTVTIVFSGVTSTITVDGYASGTTSIGSKTAKLVITTSGPNLAVCLSGSSCAIPQ